MALNTCLQEEGLQDEPGSDVFDNSYNIACLRLQVSMFMSHAHQQAALRDIRECNKLNNTKLVFKVCQSEQVPTIHKRTIYHAL